MRSIATLWILLLIVVSSCGSDVEPPPPRQDVEMLLKQEAESMKREGR